MQLSLLDTESPTMDMMLAELARSWSAQLPVARHAVEAERITAQRFGAWSGRALTAEECRRVRAYYAAVVRRRIMRGSDDAATAARRLLVQASIEADLREAGWRPERARAEARRCVGRDVTLEVA